MWNDVWFTALGDIYKNKIEKVCDRDKNVKLDESSSKRRQKMYTDSIRGIIGVAAIIG